MNRFKKLATDDASGIALAALAISILVLLILPLPPWILDVLVGLNIAIAVLLLFFVLYIDGPLDFSTFPSVLLFTTLFRIALNVATTRQILLKGDAGHVIETFGKFVVGGDLIVGLVIFFIVTIVQLIVISKGSERVAEVGARFTLDALPGKQMAIDADMKAGLLTQEEATLLRNKLGSESQFFGAMDGAMKFVKGDAIASIVIVLVNLIGGMAVGVVTFGMTLGDAALKFAILGIGDGLVSQIPALFITIAAGVLVTRTNAQKNETLGSQIGKQFSAYPMPMMLAAGVIGLFSLVPGFPFLTFFGLALIFGYAAFRSTKRIREQTVSLTYQSLQHASLEGDKKNVRWINVIDAPYSSLAIEASPDMVRKIKLTELDIKIVQLRQLYKDNLGLPWPGLSLRIRTTLEPSTVAIVVLEAPFIFTTYTDADDEKSILQSITKNLMASIYTHARSLFGTQETKRMLNTLQASHPDLCKEALQIMPLPAMAELFSLLVNDAVPLRDVRTLLESIIEYNAIASQGAKLMLETARMSLKRSICASCLNTAGELVVSEFEPRATDYLLGQLTQAADETLLDISADQIQKLKAKIYLVLDAATQMIDEKRIISTTVSNIEIIDIASPVKAVLLVRYNLRLPLSKLFENDKRLKQELRIISFSETVPGTIYVDLPHIYIDDFCPPDERIPRKDKDLIVA